MNANYKFREGGFSLVQVMVAIGLMGGLALAMMKMFDNQLKQQKTVELRAEQGDVANIIRQTLSDKEACEATFIGMSPGDDISSIRMTPDLNQPAFAQVGEKFKTFNVFIKSMYLLTRAEEITLKQRAVGSLPISSYTTGAGFGYLKVTFVKNVGAVTDANTSHNFYGAKETSTIFPVKGFFYDVEIVKHNDPNLLNQACWDRASIKGVNCNGTPDEPCTVQALNVDADPAANDFILDTATSTPLYLAECKYYRDDSPFMECAN